MILLRKVTVTNKYASALFLTRANDLDDIISSYVMQLPCATQLSDLDAIEESSEPMSLTATFWNPFMPQTELLNNVFIKSPSGAAVFRVAPVYALLVA